MSAILFFLLILQMIMASLARAEDIRDVKPPVDLPANLGWLYIVLTIAVLAAGIFLFKYFLRWARRVRKSEVPPQPPWIVALERLEALKKQNLPGLGQIKEYYTALSDIVRRYMEDRFSIKAPEMTTQEFLWYLKGSQALAAEHKNLLTDFLNSCDMVKFAKYGPSLKEMEESFFSAKKLIEETKLIPDTVTTGRK